MIQHLVGEKLTVTTLDMFMALMVVKISQVYIYAQTHQVVYIKYVQLFTCQSYVSKAV